MTTTYVLTCYNTQNKSTSRSVLVKVNKPPSGIDPPGIQINHPQYLLRRKCTPRIVSGFHCTGAPSIPYPEIAPTITWGYKNATSCTISYVETREDRFLGEGPVRVDSGTIGTGANGTFNQPLLYDGASEGDLPWGSYSVNHSEVYVWQYFAECKGPGGSARFVGPPFQMIFATALTQLQ